MMTMATGVTCKAVLPALGLVLALTGCDRYHNAFGCSRRALEVENPASMTSAGVSLEDARVLATGEFDLELAWTRDPIWSGDLEKWTFEFDEVEGLLTTGEVVSSGLHIADSEEMPKLYELYVDDPDDKANPNSAFNCRNAPDYASDRIATPRGGGAASLGRQRP